MISKLKSLLRGARPRPAPENTTPQLAVAQLLLEIARADHRTQDGELAVIRAHLASAYGLAETQLDELMQQAHLHVEHSVSLFETVEAVNQQLSTEQKNGLIHSLWQVAYADEKLDAYEEALLRRLADLLYVPHSVFIREKLRHLDATRGTL